MNYQECYKEKDKVSEINTCTDIIYDNDGRVGRRAVVSKDFLKWCCKK